MRYWLFLYAFTLSAAEISLTEKTTPIFVSLGSACEVTAKFIDFELREASFPFDWVLALNTRGIIQALNDDFQFLLDETLFEKHTYHANVLINTRYQFELRHEWSLDYNFWSDFNSYKTNMEMIQARYQRRIRRFKGLNHYGRKVYFIRVAIDFDVEARIATWATKEQRQITSLEAIELRDALRKHFPDLDFDLVIVNYPDELPEPFPPINNIIEFKFDRNTKLKCYARLFDLFLNKRFD